MKIDIENNQHRVSFANDFSKDAFDLYSEEGGFAAMLRTGVKLAQEGNRTEARHLLLRVTEAEPENETAWLWLASISEYPEELLIFLRNVLKVNPQNERAIEWEKATKSLLAKTFVQRGIEASQENRAEFAKQCFLHAIVQDQESEMGWLWLASVTESVEEKLIYLQKVLSINPANETAQSSLKSLKDKKIQALLRKANSAAIAGERETANLLLEDIMKDSPDVEEAWILKAYLADGFFEKIKCYEKVLETNPENEAARAGIASLKLLMEKSETQAEDFTEENQVFATPELVAENTEIAVEESFNNIKEINDIEEIPAEVLAEVGEKENAVYFISETEPVLGESEKNYFKVNLEEPAPVEMAEENSSAVFFDPSENYLIDDTQVPNREFSVLEENTESSFVSPIESVDSTAESADSEAAESLIEEAFIPQHDEIELLEAHESEDDFSDNQLELSLDGENSENYVAETIELTNTEASFDEQVSEENAEAESMKHREEAAIETDESPETYRADYSEKTTENISNYTDFSTLSENSYDLSDYSTEVLSSQETVNSAPTESYYSPLVEYSSSENDFGNSSANYSVEDSPVSETFETIEHFDYEINEKVETPEEIEMQQEDYVSKEPDSSETVESSATADDFTQFQTRTFNNVETAICPFCAFGNTVHSVVCASCRTILSLSDLEMILSYQDANSLVLEQAIERIESEKSARKLSSDELQILGIAYLNAKNLRKGLNCLQEASKMVPNDVVLSSKVNFLAIRLSEIEMQENKNQENISISRTIMVVDDSPTVRKLISGKLEKSGHFVVTAVDGVDAMAKLAEAVPDLILLDIAMPQLDGYQVCKMIRSNDLTKDVPVVMISGKDGFFDKVRGKMVGSTGYITKPFGPETLMKAVETYIN